MPTEMVRLVVEETLGGNVTCTDNYHPWHRQ